MTSEIGETELVEIGIGVQSDKAPGRYAEVAALAEEVGIDVVSVFSDLLFQPALPALLEMAAVTSRVRLGVAGYNPFTMHPYEIAGQYAALAARAPGRAYLGLVKGTWLTRIGVEQPGPLAHLEEAAGFIRALLAADGVGYAGTVFTLAAGTRLDPSVPPQPVPLMIGSWGPRGAALAGRVADEIKVGGTANPAMVRLTRDRVAVGEDAAGRPRGTVGVIAGAVTVVSRSRAEARALARREVALYLDAIAAFDSTVELPDGLLATVAERLRDGDAEGAGSAIPDDVLDLFAFSGDPDDVAAQAQLLIDAGASRVEFGTPHGPDEFEGITLLGRAVVPQLRRARVRT